MSKRKLHVYVVHEGAIASAIGGLINDHKIHGVYLDKTLAEKHRDKLTTDFKYSAGYMAVTKHAVRGTHLVLGNLILL